VAGRALVLTGPSGVGKTAVGLRLQQILPEPWLFHEIDRAQPSALDRAEFRSVENDRRLQHAALSATRAYLDAGFSLIIEIGLFDETDSRSLADALAGIDATVVVLSCSRSTLEQHLGERTSPVDKDWAREFHRRLGAAVIESGILETTDNRSVTEVALAVAGHARSGRQCERSSHQSGRHA
jgi:chloramphenicol 3-O-phosphotransferase